MIPDRGTMDRNVLVQQRPAADAVDSAGAPLESWTTLYRGNFHRMPIGGRERFSSHQMTAPYDTRWVGDYRPDMDRDLVDVPRLRRLVYKDRIYDIVDAQVIGRNDGIELLTLSGGTYS